MAGQSNRLSCLHHLRKIATSDLKAAAVYYHAGVATVRIYIDAKVPSSLNGQSAVWRVQLNGVIGVQLTDDKPNGPLLQTQLHDLIVQVRYGQVGLIG
jgi:hypothetical protein